MFARFDCQDAPALHRILSEPALRGAWLATIVDQALAHDYDGINLDFETGAPTDRAAFTSFVTELAGRLHKIGKKLAVDVSAKTADDRPGESGCLRRATAPTTRPPPGVLRIISRRRTNWNAYVSRSCKYILARTKWTIDESKNGIAK